MRLATLLNKSESTIWVFTSFELIKTVQILFQIFYLCHSDEPNYYSIHQQSPNDPRRHALGSVFGGTQFTNSSLCPKILRHLLLQKIIAIPPGVDINKTDLDDETCQ